MLSLKKNGGNPTALIKNGDLNNKMIYFNPLISGIDENNNISLPLNKVFVMPNKNIVEKIYISGQSGVGKSTFASNYIKLYQKMNPENDIFLISGQEKDEVLDEIPNIIRLDMDMIEEIELTDYHNSCFIFDDIDTLKENRKNIYALRDKILTNGRHYKITLICTEHLLSNYKESRIVLNECTAIVIFPLSNKANIRRFLFRNIGLSNENIDRILSTQSRWVCIYKTYPFHCVYETGAYILN